MDLRQNSVETEFDPSDTRQISFMLDLKDSEWIDKKLEVLREHDAGFYVHCIGVGDFENLYKITTKHANLQHDDFKKFMFQVELKLGNKVKIR